MTFTYESTASTPFECQQEQLDVSVPTLHIEETPCMIIPAVAITPAVSVRLWQARTARAWMT